jgi:hypothetical protein
VLPAGKINVHRVVTYVIVYCVIMKTCKYKSNGPDWNFPAF